MTSDNTSTNIATFAAGCFWGVELAYQRLPGVTNTTVGYAQGHKDEPTYQEVRAKTTGHAESVRVEYDPKEVTYAQLLDTFWSIHDPTQLNRQQEDVGTNYRTGIYYHNEEQKEIAEKSRDEAQKNYKDKIVTEIEPFKVFWPAEEYHQKYLEKGGQCAAKGCGKDIECQA